MLNIVEHPCVEFSQCTDAAEESEDKEDYSDDAEAEFMAESRKASKENSGMKSLQTINRISEALTKSRTNSELSFSYKTKSV